MRSEKELIPVIDRLSMQSKSVEQALELFQTALSGEIGGSALLIQPLDDAASFWQATSVAALMNSRLFPFRGVYTAPVLVGTRLAGRLIACFASFGSPGKSLPELTSHIAQELGRIMGRTGRAIVPRPEAA